MQCLIVQILRFEGLGLWKGTKRNDEAINRCHRDDGRASCLLKTLMRSNERHDRKHLLDEI